MGKGLKIVLILTLLPIIFVGIYFFRLETGYCFDEGKYYSEEELTDIAVVALLKKEEMLRSSFTRDELLRVKSYISKEQFYAENPDCCRLKFKSIFNRKPIVTDKRFYIFSIYHYHRQDTNAQKAFSMPAVSVCGRFRGFDPFLHPYKKNMRINYKPSHGSPEQVG